MSTGDFYQLTGAFALSDLPTIHELGLVVISYARQPCVIDAQTAPAQQHCIAKAWCTAPEAIGCLGVIAITAFTMVSNCSRVKGSVGDSATPIFDR